MTHKEFTFAETNTAVGICVALTLAVLSIGVSVSGCWPVQVANRIAARECNAAGYAEGRYVEQQIQCFNAFPLTRSEK